MEKGGVRDRMKRVEWRRKTDPRESDERTESTTTTTRDDDHGQKDGRTCKQIKVPASRMIFFYALVCWLSSPLPFVQRAHMAANRYSTVLYFFGGD